MSDEEERHSSRYTYGRRYKKKKILRKIRKNEKRLILLRSLYKLFLFIFLILLSLYIMKMPQWRLKPNLFDSLNNPALEIINNRIVPSKKILAELRRHPVPTQPIFLVNTENIKKSLTLLDPIQTVYIRRFWNPARLKVIIIERTPILVITPAPDVPPIAFFSSDGKLIGREYLPLPEDYKVYKIVTYGTEDDYRNWDLRKINTFKKIASFIEVESGEDVEYIDYRNTRDIYVKLPSVMLRLGTIDTKTFDKIRKIPSLLPQIKMLNHKVKYIDLRWDSPYFKLDDNG